MYVLHTLLASNTGNNTTLLSDDSALHLSSKMSYIQRYWHMLGSVVQRGFGAPLSPRGGGALVQRGFALTKSRVV